MGDGSGPLRHALNNAEQKNKALENLIERAADQLDALAEADCSEAAVDAAHLQAERLRRAAQESRTQI